jgi:uncharacterized membrane protein YvlD (DUF360 family)
MTQSIRTLLRSLLRLLVFFIVTTASILLTAAILPGFNVTSTETASTVIVAGAAALLVALLNAIIRPIIMLLALPLGFVVMFIISFISSALTLSLAARVLPGFDIDNLFVALIAGVVLGVIHAAISSIVYANDDDSFYQGIVERLARRQKFAGAIDQTQGIVVLEIDGLSYHHIREAIAQGYMPNVKHLMETRGYELSHIDCGLPSQTSACQAGIMFGDNFDIPSFRWLDKEKGKLYVSTKDATELNARYSKGQGLMRGGSSVNNLLNGDAASSLLTFSHLFDSTPEEGKYRSQSIYLLTLNPFFLTRMAALFIGDVILELYQGWNQKRKDVQPRLDRLHKFYPFVRAATTTLMRDIAASLVTLDIIRGAPSIYMTYCGYDEVAHHSGPRTTDAFGTLRQFDQVIARVLHTIDTKAPRPYELWLLSDHGQSFGFTFKQRYGMDLKEFLEKLLPHGTSVSQSMGGDDGATSVASMSAELTNMQEQQVGGRVGKGVMKQTGKVLDRVNAEITPAVAVASANLTVCGSGNIAQVYFDLAKRKITLTELNQAYPGMVDQLLAHEGIGFVVAYGDDCVPLVFGKRGARNLHTGEVTGDDPLKPYGDPEFRAAQVRRVADFPNSGDLIVNSTLYPDGTVAAMEELIGNHGGLGGEQTDAFILHPKSAPVPETSNSADVFHILNTRRGLVPPPVAKAAPPKAIDSWRLSTLAAGIAAVPKWLGLAARAATFDRDAYRDIAKDPLMTGPALLLVVMSVVVQILLRGVPITLTGVVLLVGAFFVLVLGAFMAARLLRGKANYTETFRVMAFGQTLYALAVLALFPDLAPAIRLIASIGVTVAVWVGVSVAHGILGWRTLLLPVVSVLMLALTYVASMLLVSGAVISIQALLRAFGLGQ